MLRDHCLNQNSHTKQHSKWYKHGRLHADSNSKDLQKPQGSNVTVNQVVRIEQPITTRPNQVGNSGRESNFSCKCCRDNILHLNASIDKPSVMYTRRKATWLKSVRISSSVLYPLARSFMLELI